MISADGEISPTGKAGETIISVIAYNGNAEGKTVTKEVGRLKFDSGNTPFFEVPNLAYDIVDGQGRILEHSAEEAVFCESWLNAVREGRLNEDHRRTVLTPEVNCNVVRDKECRKNPCARLSVPIQLGEDMLAGAVVFFLWNNDPSYEKQCLAMILAGGLSNLLQKERETTGLHRDAVRLLKELLNYKPGLKLYFENALKSSEFAGIRGRFHLCVLLPQGSGIQNTEEQAERVAALSECIWAFAHHGRIIVLFSTADYTPETFRTLIAPLVEAEQMQAGCSVSFDELLKLRYVYEDTRAALELACAEESDTSYHKSERYLGRVFLQRCRKLLPAEEYYPDFFRRLIEHDERTGKTYVRTLAAYLDNGRNTNAAAKQLFMHRNSMVQQLERIEQILGIPLDDSETCFFLQLCIRLHELE